MTFDEITLFVEESRIVQYAWDMLKNEFTFDLVVTTEGKTQNCKLVIHGVRMFQYEYERTSSPTPLPCPEEGDWLELSLIDVLSPPAEARYLSPDWLSDFSAYANLVIEIWDREIYFQASAISLDSHIVMLPEVK